MHAVTGAYFCNAHNFISPHAILVGLYYIYYTSKIKNISTQTCVQLLRSLTTWHCRHSPAAVRRAATFAAVAHAGTDSQTDGWAP